MKKIWTFGFGLAFLTGCVDKKSKKEYRSTIKVCDYLYVEKYRVFGSGALGGDLISEYLTDSTNFRMYVGTVDNGHARLIYKCKADSIFIEKLDFEEDPKSLDASKITETIVENKVYDLQELRTKKIFE